MYYGPFMINAVAVGPDNAVYSITREKGVNYVVAHEPKTARVLMETKDKLAALCIDAGGSLHAVGAKHWTNRGGAWKSTKTGTGQGFAVGEVAGTLFMGTLDGKVARLRDGAAWEELGALGDDPITSITGTSATDVDVGMLGGFGHWDGKSLTTAELPDGLYEVQAAFAGKNGELWVVGGDALARRANAAGPIKIIARVDDGELYGVGVAGDAVFGHAGFQLVKLDGKKFAVVHDNEDKALMSKNAEFSTAMTSNGKRAVAGGARSVLVSDGGPFVEWAGLAQAAAAGAGAATASPKAKPAKAASPARKVAKR